MGEVWRGVHPTEGVEVATKVMTSSKARVPRFIEAFRSEVRAMAGLDHPGVVRVFDYGAVSEEVSVSSGGRFVAGSPYLVMERVAGGSLKEWVWPQPWSVVRGLVLQLLRALGHAHARGVIHRDIKPSNVLVVGASGSVGSQVKLSDFGIAQAVEERIEHSDVRETTTGTPRYMSPEQLRGLLRDYGPWTDLYALGCMTYELLCGEPPFRGNFLQLIQEHLLSPMPALEAPWPVPEAVEGWLRRMLAKAPRDRYETAADAAYALELLTSEEVGVERGPQVERGRPGRRVEGLEAVTVMLGVDDSGDATPTEIPWVVGEVEAARGPAQAMAPRLSPPWPADWRVSQEVVPRGRMSGVGLGLFGLRTIPLVGRLAERELLWQELGAVRREGRPRLVWVRGAGGLGKTRLCSWLTQHAYEAGVATGLRALHSPIRGPGDGLGAMVSRRLRCGGLKGAALAERVRTFLAWFGEVDADEEEALAELIHPEGRVLFSNPVERYVLVERVLRRLAGDRALIVQFDDAQWGAEALGLAEHLLSQGGPFLLLATVRADALAEREDERELYTRLRAHPRASEVGLEALAEADRVALARELLGLSDDLAREVEARSGGNPLFAIQLVGDWVQRGVLVAGWSGFVLAAGAGVDVPESLHQVWSERVAQILAPLPESDRVALEVAAALGGEVDEAEWAASCGAAGVSASGGLVEALQVLRLVRPWRDGVGWSFEHIMLRETLGRQAREAGRWRSAHRACASALGALGVERGRVGRHLMEAAALDEAVEALHDGAWVCLRRGEYRRSNQLLDEAERALAHLGVPQSDVRWGEGWLQRMRQARLMADLDVAARVGERLAVAAREHGWASLVPEILMEQSLNARKQGNLKLAQRKITEAQGYGPTLGQEARARLNRGLGLILAQLGDFDGARRAFTEALELHAPYHDPEFELQCYHLLGLISRNESDLEASTAMSTRALEMARQYGFRGLVPVCQLSLGEDARVTGRAEEAEQHYRKAAEAFRALGSQDESCALLNVALAQIDQGRFDEAREQLTALRRVFADQGRTIFLGGTHIALLPCEAHRGAWERFEECLTVGAEILERIGFVEHDMPRLAERGAELAMRAGERELARRAYRFALKQVEAMGRGEEVVRIGGILAGLEA